LYGVEPDASQVDANASFGVHSVLSFESQISLIQDIRPGEGVSYGLRWRAKRDSRIGVIPCGYADGYRRGLSNQASVIVRARRVPVVGTVCMDYFMCDLTEVESASVGDSVTLIGKQGGVSVTASELAGFAQTIPYEILTGISERVPRLYVDDEASAGYS
jgi:alanine racemase